MRAVELPTTKPVREMSDAERRALLKRRDPATTGGAMDIGGGASGGRVIRGVTITLATAAIAAAFVLAFYSFTASWRVAVVVVGLMLGYMAVIGRMVEGRADRIE